MPEADTHTLNLEEDRLLFRQIAEGDQQAFREVFDRFVPRIRPAIRAITGEEAPVKDIIQDVFLLLWIGREKLAEVVSPENWLFRMVHYECYKWLRHRKVVNIANDQLTARSLSQSNSTEESASFAETSRLLKEAVASLPTQARKVYLLRREAGLSPSEIARQLFLSEKTVKNTLTRALKYIEGYLRERGILIPLTILALLMVP